MIWQSTSWKSARALVRPWPPAPMSATLTLSLGATKRGPPRTCRGTMVNAAAAAGVVARKSRRVAVGFGILVIVSCPEVGIYLHCIGWAGQWPGQTRQTDQEALRAARSAAAAGRGPHHALPASH